MDSAAQYETFAQHQRLPSQYSYLSSASAPFEHVRSCVHKTIPGCRGVGSQFLVSPTGSQSIVPANLFIVLIRREGH